MEITILLTAASILLTPYLLQGQAAIGMETNLIRLEQATFDSHQIMLGRKKPPATVKGDYYLNDDWYTGTITLKTGQTIKAYPLKYDIENDFIEIKTKEEIKILKGERITSYQWYNPSENRPVQYIKAHGYTLDGTPLLGFFKVLVDDTLKLFSKTETRIKKASYVEGLDMGDRSDKIIKHEKFYLADGHYRLSEIKNKSDLLNVMVPERAKDVLNFIKKEKLKISEQKDLVAIVTYCNNLNR